MINSNIHRFEDEIFGCSIRRCGTFDSNGKKLLDRQEKFYKFTFSDIERQEMKGNILTYNTGEEVVTLFAKDMIGLATSVQLKELRVVTNSGTYSLMPSSLNWPTYDMIFNTFNSTDLDDHLLNKLLPGQCVELWEQKHNIWENVAKKLGLKYERFPPQLHLDMSWEDFIDD